MKKIGLDVLGISYSQTQSGAYALILGEKSGKRRIPIIIGSFEAQSIAIQLEKLKPPRPLTHDLFHQVALEYHVMLTEVFIYKLEEGIFYSKMFFTDGENVREFDTRTSDAIALALRYECPISIDASIIEVAGIIFDIDMEKSGKAVKKESKKSKASKKAESVSELASMGTSELKGSLDEAIHNEDYERASLLRDEINRRTKR